ncbi:MAG: CocE/NonD family hydrolase [Chitinophagaceae bacterium]|nr:CocE/NonD family hydrolase [Chitinophagaceae bacterium]
MFLRILRFFILFFPVVSFSQTDQDSAWILDNYTKTEVYIPMRDGVKLFTSIYQPKDKSEKHPILLTRTPYSCAPYGTAFSPRLWQRHIKYYLRENYIIVTQDVRGRWMSEGEFMDVRPFIANKKGNETDEASDTYDTIEWLIQNIPNNNGRVGVFGISYPGFYSTMAAASGHPALKAVSPQAPVTDWFIGDDFHHNGAFFRLDGFRFYSSFGKPRPKPTTVPPKGFDFHIRDNYQFHIEYKTLKELAGLMGDSIRFWKEMYAHPNYDDWWKARDARRAMYNIKPAMLVVGGTFDAEDCWGAWNLYKAIEKQNPGIYNKIVMGPWYHGQWASRDGSKLGPIRFGSNTAIWYQNNIEIPFFNYFLKGKGEEPPLAEATVFFSGENQWKRFDQWPPKEMEWRPVYLNEGGTLSFRPPARNAKQKFSEYISDPDKPVPYTPEIHFNRTIEYMVGDQRFAARRPDILVFQSDILEEDVTLAGPVIADLKVSLSTTDADFVVKVIDVFPYDFRYAENENPENNSVILGGYQMLVRGEIMRGRFRNSFEKPEPFKPGKTETVKFELPDVAHTFKKGHRIMIQIQSSWFPLADMNPQTFVNIYEAERSDFQKATIRIHHSAEHPSAVFLPVLNSSNKN